MQAFGPRTSTAGTTYTSAQIQALLTNPVGQERWIWDRLDKTGRYVADLTTYVEAGSNTVITHDTTRAIKRSFRARIRADANMNWVSDLIKPHYQIKAADGGWIDFPLGVFLPINSQKNIMPSVTWRTVDGSDQGQILLDGAFADTYTVAAGTSYYQAIKALVKGYILTNPETGLPAMLISDPGKTLPTSLTWSAGQTRLQAVTDLLAACAYTTPWFDENGFLRSSPLQNFPLTNSTFTFDTTASGGSIVAQGGGGSGSGIGDLLDIANAYNQVLVTVEDPQRNSLSYMYQNTSALSPTSVPNWHPKLIIVRNSTIVDTAAMKSYAKYLAQTYARVYSNITMSTLAWPLSQDLDVYGFVLNTRDEGTIDFNYVETKWSMRCGAGLQTDHTIQRIVPS